MLTCCTVLLIGWFSDVFRPELICYLQGDFYNMQRLFQLKLLQF